MSVTVIELLQRRAGRRSRLESECEQLAVHFAGVAEVSISGGFQDDSGLFMVTVRKDEISVSATKDGRLEIVHTEGGEPFLDVDLFNALSRPFGLKPPRSVIELLRLHTSHEEIIKAHTELQSGVWALGTVIHRECSTCGDAWHLTLMTDDGWLYVTHDGSLDYNVRGVDRQRMPGYVLDILLGPR